VQDIAIYLRPESNGVRVESVMLGVLRRSTRFRERVELAYLANIPGSFIAERGVVQEHYATRVYFARAGRDAFTGGMRRRFEEAFETPFDAASIMGAYEALDRLAVSAEELFAVRVPPPDYAVILGQSVKRYAGYYIVNYDVPAILAKHDEHTDVFSMLLRSGVEYAEFQNLVRGMGNALRDEKIVSDATPASRVFHYSKGPFEQILDALGYLHSADGARVAVSDISFARYLVANGFDESRIVEIIRNPLLHIAAADGSIDEIEIFEHTRGDSYPAALAKLKAVVGAAPPPGQTPR
jgi:hypothetical protein